MDKNIHKTFIWEPIFMKLDRIMGVQTELRGIAIKK